MIEDKEDFFEETPEDKPEKVKEPKAPRLRPDDPEYYEREEDRWEHLKPSPYSRGPILWAIAAAIVGMTLIIGLFIYFFTPEVDEAVQYGYVENVQREGKLFKTYEGVILPYRTLMDTVRPYEGDFVFSAASDSIAGALVRQQGVGNPVKVGYKVYRVSLPWRGKSKVVVVSVDSVPDPYILLPHDRRPSNPQP